MPSNKEECIDRTDKLQNNFGALTYNFGVRLCTILADKLGTVFAQLRLTAKAQFRHILGTI